MSAQRPKAATFRTALPSSGGQDRSRFQIKERSQTAYSRRSAPIGNRRHWRHVRTVALVGRARVSTEEQDPAPQFYALRAAGCADVFEEQASEAIRAWAPC